VAQLGVSFEPPPPAATPSHQAWHSTSRPVRAAGRRAASGSVSLIDPTGVSPVELQERIRADRHGSAYVLFRDASGSQRIRTLGAESTMLTIGRDAGCDLCLEWDSGVSRAHARLERLGRTTGCWSTTGFHVMARSSPGERLGQRRRLVDGDVMRFGATALLYRAPRQQIRETVTTVSGSGEIHLTPAQRRVLIVPCGPYRDGDRFATSASNRAIAEELVLSVEAVKTQLRALFEKFDVEPLARDAKRARLAQRAFETGVISRADLRA
jgi:FHA domain